MNTHPTVKLPPPPPVSEERRIANKLRTYAARIEDGEDTDSVRRMRAAVESLSDTMWETRARRAR
jgi:hypothetical protein